MFPIKQFISLTNNRIFIKFVLRIRCIFTIYQTIYGVIILFWWSCGDFIVGRNESLPLSLSHSTRWFNLVITLVTIAGFTVIFAFKTCMFEDFFLLSSPICCPTNQPVNSYRSAHQKNSISFAQVSVVASMSLATLLVEDF